MTNVSPTQLAQAGAPAPLTDEAERLRSVFEAAVAHHLPVMTASVRAIVRAWAEAETAIAAAHHSSEPGAADLPPAESFRVRPFLPREEVSRERVTCWCHSLGRKPLADDLAARVAYLDGSWVVMNSSGTGPIMQLRDRAEFERITYKESQSRLELPLLVKAMTVPARVAGEAPGWEAPRYLCSASALAYLNDLEAGILFPQVSRPETVEYILQHYVSAPKPPIDTTNLAQL